MEPGFQRGDILFLENNTEELIIGDVVVFKIKGRDIPIVHRVLSKYKRCVVCCGDGDYAAACPLPLPPSLCRRIHAARAPWRLVDNPCPGDGCFAAGKEGDG